MITTGHGMHVPTSGDGFQFSRIFPHLPAFMISPQAAMELGLAMTTEEAPRNDGDIPAGYTYFGQFIDHDITRDSAGDVLSEQTESKQLRSPTLDLDSVYGSVPEGSNGGVSPRAGKGGAFFEFGTTRKPGNGLVGADEELKNDLPRGTEKDGSKVFIPDDRNDENLIVGQMHVAWMKFHNAVASQLSVSDDLFEQTRELVIKHYQHIVLHDFLKRVCDPDVWRYVVQDERTEFFDITGAETATMPLEFAGAAFRFGHTMIRQSYDWNENFNKNKARDAVFDGRDLGKEQSLSLFFHTRHNLSSDKSLETTWVADWRRMLDFFDTGFDASGVSMNNAVAFDPFLASGMGRLERDQNNPKSILNNLAASNLRRGALRGLPSGQDIAKAMGLPILSRAEMNRNMTTKMLTLVDDLDLDKKAPLWFYILQEANARAGGKHLGEMGSIIVAETFVSLVRASRPSIITHKWNPADSPLRLRNGSAIDSLPKMMVFCDENGQEVINPLAKFDND